MCILCKHGRYQGYSSGGPSSDWVYNCGLGLPGERKMCQEKVTHTNTCWIYRPKDWSLFIYKFINIVFDYTGPVYRKKSNILLLTLVYELRWWYKQQRESFGHRNIKKLNVGLRPFLISACLFHFLEKPQMLRWLWQLLDRHCAVGGG